MEVRILLVLSADRVAILSGVSTFPLDFIRVLLQMLHSSGNNHATGDLTDTETRFDDLFGVTTSVLFDFFVFGAFDLNHHCYFYHYCCQNGNKRVWFRININNLS